MTCKILNKSDCLLEVRNLHYHIQHQTILQGLNFAIPQGKLTVLIGPNGAGKSTLMRILSGYLAASQGECYFKHKALQHDLPMELAHQRAVMRQHSQLNFPFSVEEVIRMGGYHRRKQEVEQWLETVIDITDCQSLRSKPYSRLSGGEQQRVAIARALAKNPKLLLCDEPTGALDYQTGKAILRLLQDTCREKGKTVIVITHNTALCAMADRVITVKSGMVTEERVNEHPVDVAQIEW